MKIGVGLPHMEGDDGSSLRWSEIAVMARLAEDAGFDSLWVVDHLIYQLRGEQRLRGVWEGWSLLSALSAITSRVELGTLVLGMGFRNPALLAKMADTVEEISDGRLILGVGAGYHQIEYRAFGFPYDYRFSRFAEAIQIVHALLRTGRVDFEGRFYTARECELRPRGPRPEGPPIMIGSCSPKMLELTARYAEQWNAFYDDTRNSVEEAQRLKEVVDAACLAAGRDPATLERTVTVLVARPGAPPGGASGFAAHWGAQPLTGSPEEMAAELLRYETAGVSHIQLWLEDRTLAGLEAILPVLEAVRRG